MGFKESTISDLENIIGDQIYIRIENWNLYLGDAGLARRLAIELLSNLEKGSKEATKLSLDDLLVKVGDGKNNFPLSSLIPASQINELAEILDSLS
tara:strand:+ start:154 stop:441 length:288 start_codon:yes stop_codon:yes gene_type:complete